jgi:hypothetical protein
MSASASNSQPAESFELWTIRGLIAKHKAAALVVAGLFALTAVTLVFVALGSNGRAVTDATTCTQWGSTNQTGQTAYAELYLKEHGPIPRWGGSRADVINAINWGCGVAFGDAVSDTATVVQAIDGTF